MAEFLKFQGEWWVGVRGMQLGLTLPERILQLSGSSRVEVSTKAFPETGLKAAFIFGVEALRQEQVRGPESSFINVNISPTSK